MSQSQAVKYYHGLVNQGATCYLNSVLQVLYMTDDFKERVKSHTRNNTGTKHIDRELSDLFKVLEKYHGDTYNITKKLNISNVCEQRDAAEHYEKILRLASPEASQIFHGELINRNTCLQCRIPTESEAGFWLLPLPLVDSKDGYSVEKGIEDFFCSSLVSEDNQMYCERCDEKCDAFLDCEVKHHPEVLVLLLKRFEIDYTYMRKVKICCPVKMPDTLRMPKNLESYKLYAFVEHSGDLRFGHYIAKIKSQHNGRWYHFDDLNVTSDYEHFQLDPTETSENVYLLFYQRQKDQHADTPLPDIDRYYSPQSSQAGVTNGTEDTHSSIEESERVENNSNNTAGVTNAHKKEHGTKDKQVRSASERGALSRENQPRVENHNHCRRTKQKQGSVEEKINRNGESSQDECHVRFQENVSALNINSHSRLQNNNQDYISIEISKDIHEEMRERSKSKSQDFDKVAHTKCKEPNVTMNTPGPHNEFSNVNVNTDYYRQSLSEAHEKNVNDNGFSSGQYSTCEGKWNQQPNNNSAFKLAEYPKKNGYKTVMNAQYIQSDVGGGNKSNRYCMHSDPRQSSVSVNRNTQSSMRQMDSTVIYQDKYVKSRDEKKVEKYSVKPDRDVYVLEEGRPGSERPAQTNSKYCSQDVRLEKFKREVERKVDFTNEERRSHKDKSGYDSMNRLGKERRTEINKSVQENSQNRIKRNSDYRSHDKSKGNDRSFMRNSCGDRGHNLRKIDILPDSFKTLKLTEENNGEQKRREGKKQAYPEGSQDSIEGHREQNNTVTQDSFNEDVESSKERGIELETNANQPKKKKYKCSCLPLCNPWKKRTK